MSFHVTPANLVSAYELLRTTPPFRGWRLPHPDDVAFKVCRRTDIGARIVLIPDKPPSIEVSSKAASTLPVLLRYMAHEMVHLHEHISGDMRGDCMHGQGYRRRATRVCAVHCFDPMEFGGLE